MCGPEDRLEGGEKEGGKAVTGRQSHKDVVTSQTRAGSGRLEAMNQDGTCGRKQVWGGWGELERINQCFHF